MSMSLGLMLVCVAVVAFSVGAIVGYLIGARDAMNQRGEMR